MTRDCGPSRVDQQIIGPALAAARMSLAASCGNFCVSQWISTGGMCGSSENSSAFVRMRLIGRPGGGCDCCGIGTSTSVWLELRRARGFAGARLAGGGRSCPNTCATACRALAITDGLPRGPVDRGARDGGDHGASCEGGESCHSPSSSLCGRLKVRSAAQGVPLCAIAVERREKSVVLVGRPVDIQTGNSTTVGGHVRVADAGVLLEVREALLPKRAV